MSLATAVKEGPRTAKKGPDCGVGKVFATLMETNTEDLAALYLMLGDARWTAEDISAELREAGWDIKGSTVARHRRGACRCEAL